MKKKMIAAAAACIAALALSGCEGTTTAPKEKAGENPKQEAVSSNAATALGSLISVTIFMLTSPVSPPNNEESTSPAGMFTLPIQMFNKNSIKSRMMTQIKATVYLPALLPLGNRLFKKGTGIRKAAFIIGIQAGIIRF